MSLSRGGIETFLDCFPADQVSMEKWVKFQSEFLIILKFFILVLFCCLGWMITSSVWSSLWSGLSVVLNETIYAKFSARPKNFERVDFVSFRSGLAPGIAFRSLRFNVTRVHLCILPPPCCAQPSRRELKNVRNCGMT